VLIQVQANDAMTALQPWRKDAPEETTRYFIACAFETLRITGTVLQPLMPSTTERLLDALNVLREHRTWAHTGLGQTRVGEVRSVKLFEQRQV
jgi:methionyl-tRNA synthetase